MNIRVWIGHKHSYLLDSIDSKTYYYRGSNESIKNITGLQSCGLGHGSCRFTAVEASNNARVVQSVSCSNLEYETEFIGTNIRKRKHKHSYSKCNLEINRSASGVYETLALTCDCPLGHIACKYAGHAITEVNDNIEIGNIEDFNVNIRMLNHTHILPDVKISYTKGYVAGSTWLEACSEGHSSCRYRDPVTVIADIFVESRESSGVM